MSRPLHSVISAFTLIILLLSFYQAEAVLPKIMGHRGLQIGPPPENSLPAIAEAVALGASMVELDPGTTSDGQLILMHDYTLDRTTNGSGYLRNSLFNYVRSLELTYNPAYPEYAGLQVPTYVEAVQEIARVGGEGLLLDTRPLGYTTEQVESNSRLIGNAWRDAGLEEKNLIIKVSSQEAIDSSLMSYKQSLFGDISFMYRLGSSTEWMNNETFFDQIKANGVNWINVSSSLDRDSVDFLHEKGFSLWAFVCCTAVKEAISLGVDVIDSHSRPDYLLNFFPTLMGDANDDGALTSEDVSILEENFGKYGGWSAGNFDDDWVVGMSDALLLRNQLQSVGNFELANDLQVRLQAFVTTPEPSIYGLFSAIFFLANRKRKRISI